MSVPPNDSPELLRTATPVVHGAFRAVTGFFFACHGAASLFGVLGGAHGGGTVPTLAWPGWWAAVIQLVGGSLVALGLFTRTAAVISSGSMAYAYFSVHQSNGLFPLVNGGEASAMFCWAFLLIAFIGPGAFALENILRRGTPAARASEPVTPVRTS